MDMNENNKTVKEPRTPNELLSMHKLLRSDPQQYLRIVNGWINENPKNSQAYYSRHFAWLKIGEPHRALEDLNKVFELTNEPDSMSLLSRGEVYRHIGEYEKALGDFDRGEAMNPKRWEEDAFGLLYQADTHARLGNEAKALSYCARLPNDFWTPGLGGAPAGDKADIADKLRHMAAIARRRRV
jgi:tetratricopeptide (TPR) repeat protein